MGQSVNDTYEEKGLAYITGNLTGDIAGMYALGKVGDLGKGILDKKLDGLNIRNRVLKNIEESRLARESSNFGDFARFEREFNERLATKGAGNCPKGVSNPIFTTTEKAANVLGEKLINI